MSAEQTRFDWKASESAPEHYPMQIISGDLRYHGNPNGSGLYVPSGVILYHGWGLMRSSHVTGDALKPLPDKLDITFFSYLEDQFYRGSFDLPYETILRLFREEEAKPKRQAMDGSELPNDYVIIIGVAPGGTVAVWMQGQGAKELFFGQAKKIEMDITESAKAFRVPITDRKKYVEKNIGFVLAPDVHAAIRKNGIPFQKWANYRTRYNWMPTFTGGGHVAQKIGISFYNGEGAPYKLPLEKSFTAATHPVPDKIKFSYTLNGQAKEYYYIVRFDETEITNAFTHLSTKQLPMQLEFTPAVPIEQTKIRLHNGKEAIPLNKFTVKRK